MGDFFENLSRAPLQGWALLFCLISVPIAAAYFSWKVVQTGRREEESRKRLIGELRVPYEASLDELSSSPTDPRRRVLCLERGRAYYPGTIPDTFTVHLALVLVVFVTACQRPQPAHTTDGGLPPANEQAHGDTTKPWSVKPTRLDDIRTDPSTYLERPALVYVGVKPCDNFNYGYRNARDTHFCFEMQSLPEGKDGDCNGENCFVGESMYGYANKSWARPFFEEVKKVINGDDGISAIATLWVAYNRNRYKGDTAQDIEILAAVQGRAPKLAAPTNAATASETAMEGPAGTCAPECIDSWMAAVERGCVTKKQVCSSLTTGAMVNCVSKSGAAEALYPELTHGDFSSVGAIVSFVFNTRKKYGCPSDPTTEELKAERAKPSPWRELGHFGQH